MLEHGVSLARVRYAFNSTNAEGWGLYSEYLIKPYMPLEGQLISLQMRLQRAARAFLDPELQSGKLTPKDAFHVLEQDVVAFARDGPARSRALHLPRSRTGEQLLLRLHAADLAARRDGEGVWARSSTRRSFTTSSWRKDCCRPT